MQGSYILLAAFGIFILIGGAKRILKSLRLSSVTAVLIIIGIVVLNLFKPIGKDISIYLGSMLLIALCLIYIFNNPPKIFLWIFFSVAVIAGVILLYRTQIIDNFNIGDTPATVMIIGGCAVSSFILSKNAGQAFIVSVLSVFVYGVVIFLMNKEKVIIGDNIAFDIMIYSALGAVLLNEIVTEIVSLFADRTPDLSFEAGMIEDEEKGSGREDK